MSTSEDGVVKVPELRDVKINELVSNSIGCVAGRLADVLAVRPREVHELLCPELSVVEFEEWKNNVQAILRWLNYLSTGTPWP